MFHRETFKNLTNRPIHELLFYVFLFLIPIQTRIIFNSDSAYISWAFNYHLAIFLYLSDILLVACFISWLLFHRPKLRLDKLFWLILAFFGIILVSLAVKHNGLALYGTFKWFELLFLVLYLRETLSVKHIPIFVGILFISSVSQAILALLQFHVQHSLGLRFLGEYIAPLGTSGLATVSRGTEKIIRAYGTLPHPNVLGAFLVLGLIAGLYLVSRLAEDGESRRARGTSEPSRPEGEIPLKSDFSGFDFRSGSKWLTKILVSCGIIVLIIGIFSTFSRVSWLATGLTMLGFTIYHWIRKQWSTVIVIVIVSIVSCGTILALWQGLLFARAWEPNSASITDRQMFNNFGLEAVKQHPLLGVGVGNYIPALQTMKPDLEPWQYQPPHNIFIFLAAELGLIGLILFVWILFEIIRGLKNVPHGPLLFTAYCLLLTVLLMGQFDHYFVTIQQGRLMLFTILGVLSVLPNLRKEKLE